MLVELARLGHVAMCVTEAVLEPRRPQELAIGNAVSSQAYTCELSKRFWCEAAAVGGAEQVASPLSKALRWPGLVSTARHLIGSARCPE